MPSLLGTLTLISLLQGSAAPPATPPEEEIRVDESIEVELRQLYVTVTSPGGPVRDLKAEDFEILDNGVPQPVVTFARGDIALAAVLLVDASASMEGERLKTAVAGARAFISRLQPDDEVSVMLFSDELLSSTPFGHDPATLLTPLEGVAARGGTAIHDHLYLAFEKLEDRAGRSVVVLLSDGVDVESALEMREVRWMAQRSQTLLYWIRLRDETRGRIERSTSWRDRAGHDAQIRLLETTVAESGGRIEEIPSVEQVGAAFQKILRDLREQYILGFTPAIDRDDGTWHDIEVRVRRIASRVRTREGYFDH